MQLGSFILAWQGRVEAAAASAKEGLTLAARAGETSSGSFQHAMHAHISALRGDVDGCDDHRTAVMEHSDGQSTASVDWAWGRLALSRGRPEEALPVLLGVVSEPDSHPVVGLFATPDLVEAAVATGQREVAVEPYERFVSWGRAGAPWAASVEPRLAALMATDSDDRNARFEAACRAPGLTYRPLESARTRLCYANALRTQRRRSEAREQLHVALGLFDGLQLPAWADLARAALRASGEATNHQLVPSEGMSGALTEQELTIARLVSSGSSNREVADVLHLSSRTVEYHLSKIYVKLGLSSREQLAPALVSETR